MAFTRSEQLLVDMVPELGPALREIKAIHAQGRDMIRVHGGDDVASTALRMVAKMAESLAEERVGLWGGRVAPLAQSAPMVGPCDDGQPGITVRLPGED